MRTIVIATEDGQRHVFDYDTDIEGLDHEALDAEVRAALTETITYHLQTRSDGTTATFYTELTSIEFLTP